MTTPFIAGAPYRPPVHAVVYGGWGAGKSTFMSTWPKPMLVLFTDPPGKEAPYMRRGLVGPRTVGEHGQPIQQIMSPKRPDTVLIQVEFFYDTNPMRPTAHNRMRNRFAEVVDVEVPSGQVATLVVDGVTFLELNARKQAEYVAKAGVKEPRQFYAYSAHECEEMVMQHCGFLDCNVGVVAHVDSNYDEVAGINVHTPAAPGKMRTRFGAGFPEMYVAHALTTLKGKERTTDYWLQTRTDMRYAAASGLLQAPDPCEPTFAALWQHFDLPTADTAGTHGANSAENGADAPKEATDGIVQQ